MEHSGNDLVDGAKRWSATVKEARGRKWRTIWLAILEAAKLEDLASELARVGGSVAAVERREEFKILKAKLADLSSNLST